MTGVGIERNTSAHAVPRHVHSAILSKGKLCAANGTHRDGSPCLTVDGEWPGKAFRTWFASDIEKVAAFGIAFVIDEVDDTFAIHCRLWLDAAVGSAEQVDVFRLGRADAEKKQKQGDAMAENHGNSFHFQIVTKLKHLIYTFLSSEKGREGFFVI